MSVSLFRNVDAPRTSKTAGMDIPRYRDIRLSRSTDSYPRHRASRGVTVDLPEPMNPVRNILSYRDIRYIHD